MKIEGTRKPFADRAGFKLSEYNFPVNIYFYQ